MRLERFNDMHLIPYLIDLSLCTAALINRKITLLTGSVLVIEGHDITNYITTAVCFITGFTTVYRFVKEVRHDRREAAKKKAERKASKD